MKQKLLDTFISLQQPKRCAFSSRSYAKPIYVTRYTRYITRYITRYMIILNYLGVFQKITTRYTRYIKYYKEILRISLYILCNVCNVSVP